MSEPLPRIRTSASSDFAAITALLAPSVAASQLLERADDEMLTLIENGFVALEDERIVGFCAVEIYSRKLGEIQGLTVDPEYRSRGVGRRLVMRCVERARERGVHELMAITATEELFADCGFHYALPEQKRALFIHPQETGE